VRKKAGPDATRAGSGQAVFPPAFCLRLDRFEFFAVFIDRGEANAFHQDEIVDGSERSVRFPKLDYGLCFGRSNTRYLRSNFAGVRGIDVDAFGRCRAEREAQKTGQQYFFEM
jgi:hypothetical protein